MRSPELHPGIGAELANIVNEAALHAVRCGRKFATQADLMESVEVVIAGYQKKNRILSDKEKTFLSRGWSCTGCCHATNSAPVQKITIIPRTSGALGYTMQVEERASISDEQNRDGKQDRNLLPAAVRQKN